MSTVKSPAETTQAVCNIGQGKGSAPLGKTFYMGIRAGAYIGLGALLAIKIAGGMPMDHWGYVSKFAFAALFPVGLIMVVITGAELFTGNCMYMASAMAGERTGFGGLMRNWVSSYFGNFAGGLLVAFFLGYCTGLFFDKIGDSMPLAAYAVGIANSKCSLSWGTAFVRGIGCNWLVCLAVFMAVAASDGISKFFLIWFPIMAFVAMGFEHCVANMTFIPLGIFLGSSDTYANSGMTPALTATWGTFIFNNLIPVTLGNIVGGSLLAALVKGFGVTKPAA